MINGRGVLETRRVAPLNGHVESTLRKQLELQMDERKMSLCVNECLDRRSNVRLKMYAQA